MSSSRSQAYTDAGVNINAGNELVTRIKTLVAGTHTHGVLSDIGGFGGLFRPDVSGMQAPVLVASTDGVGTKLKLASMFNKHDTVGIDLVAMSVNDILVQGAKPLFFLDYFATGELNVEQAVEVVGGVAEGCRRAGCTLLGGETAEMPGMYAPGDYDLAGFCVGLVDNACIVDGSGISVGDVVIGLASSGIHSNGYTLVRKLFEASGAGPEDIVPGTDRNFRDVLLEPTIIYADLLRSLMRDLHIKGMVHITGAASARMRPHPFRLLGGAAHILLVARAGRSELGGDASDFQLRHRLYSHCGSRYGRRTDGPSDSHAGRRVGNRRYRTSPGSGKRTGRNRF